MLLRCSPNSQHLYLTRNNPSGVLHTSDGVTNVSFMRADGIFCELQLPYHSTKGIPRSWVPADLKERSLGNIDIATGSSSRLKISRSSSDSPPKLSADLEGIDVVPKLPPWGISEKARTSRLNLLRLFTGYIHRRQLRHF